MKLYDIIQKALAFLTGSEGIECIVGSFKRLRRVPTDTVKITGIETMPKDLQNYMDKVLEVFIDVHGEVPQIHFEVIS